MPSPRYCLPPNCGHHCVCKGVGHPVEHTAIAQKQDSTVVSVSSFVWRDPKHEGGIYNVADARNFAGANRGALSVVKWVRDSHSCPEQHHLRTAVRTARKAADIVHHFEKELGLQGWSIHVNEPTIVQCRVEEHGLAFMKPAMVERYIPDFCKFNSNTGWVRPSNKKYNLLLQALCHFSYSFSGGEYVLCNLKGGVDEDEKRIVLTEPSILTVKGGVFGCTDIGERGICNFFRWHKCSAICRHLSEPEEKKILFRPVKYKGW